MIKLFDRKLNVQWSDWVVQYNLFSHFKDTEFCLQSNNTTAGKYFKLWNKFIIDRCNRIY